MPSGAKSSMGAASRRKPRQKSPIAWLYQANQGQVHGRSALAQAMAHYRAELMASLGGVDDLSAQELTWIEIAATGSSSSATIGESNGHSNE